MGSSVWTVGRTGRPACRLIRSERDGFGQRLEVAGPGAGAMPCCCRWSATSRRRMRWSRPASSWRRAARRSLAMHALESLKGAKGRLELVGPRQQRRARLRRLCPYARCARECALQSLRPYVTRTAWSWSSAAAATATGASARMMGAIATRLADRVYVTDDNPRSEDPAAIRARDHGGKPGRHRDRQTGQRRSAPPSPACRPATCCWWPARAMRRARRSARRSLPFSDHEAVKAAIAGRDYHG